MPVLNSVVLVGLSGAVFYDLELMEDLGGLGGAGGKNESGVRMEGG